MLLKANNGESENKKQREETGQDVAHIVHQSGSHTEQ
jgi:hypothetical protein